jgi:hypothetical protein
MAGIYTDLWKIVKPSAPKKGYVTDNPDDFRLYSNFSWYSKVMKGAGSRYQKYSQYKNMDGDVFVSRALDQIASEMTSEDSKTNLPFKITYQSEANEEVPENIVITVRAALRHWCDLQNLNKLTFDIARISVKFGDCFFIKKSDFKPWEYIEPQDVIGIHIDKETGKPQFYQIRKGDSTDKNAFGDAEVIPAAGVVHFSLSSGIGDNGPFGESVLFPTIKAFRHLSLLEDSVIIYRIVRAPERRVFSIDVGNMPPQRAKAYLEGIKNEIRQKRVPNESGGQEKIDSVYNPMCLTLDTKVPLLDGRILMLSELIAEQNAGKQNWVHSIDPVTGKLAPGLISWAGVTRRDAETVTLTLDNGKTITCTPDHKFPTKNRGFVEAKDLTSFDSLYSFETRDELIGSTAYQQIFDHSENKWQFTHRVVGEFFKSLGKQQELTFSPEHIGAYKDTVHHADFDAKNNHPANLQWMNKVDHILYHSMLKKEWWAAVKGNPEKLAALKRKISESLIHYYAEMSAAERTKLSEDASARINEWMLRLKADPAWVEKLKTIQQAQGQARKHRMLTDPTFKSKINSAITVTRDMVGRIVELVKAHDLDRSKAFEVVSSDARFNELTLQANAEKIGTKGCKITGKLTEKLMRAVYQQYGYDGWKHFKASSATYNHRIISITQGNKQDTGCITIDGEHKYHTHHTFALEAGVFTKNSMVEDYFFMQTADGRGSKVDTLSGGENLGEISDLNYFQNKFLQGLRIPSSYMRGSDDNGTQVQDGKVGVAYMEERNFFKYIQRLQRNIDPTYDVQFKAYLKSAGIRIDHNLFKIELNDPQNFNVYKQAEVDEKLMSNFNNIKDIPYIAARTKLARYLGWSEDEIQMNEEILKKELALPKDDIDERLTILRMIYDQAWIEHRPEPKVDESWDNHVEASKRQVSPEEADAAAEEEAPPEEEAPEGGEEEEAPSDENEEKGDESLPSLDDMKKTLGS